MKIARNSPYHRVIAAFYQQSQPSMFSKREQKLRDEIDFPLSASTIGESTPTAVKAFHVQSAKLNLNTFL
jgi:hypothetical protein